jgi:hypothetical protein
MAGSDGDREPNGAAERSRTQDNVPDVSDQVVGAGVATLASLFKDASPQPPTGGIAHLMGRPLS